MTHQYKPLHLHVIIPVSADPHKLPARSFVTRLPKTGCSAPPIHAHMRARAQKCTPNIAIVIVWHAIRACVRACEYANRMESDARQG